MDHQQATESMAVEKYLLQEMTPEARDEFEEHFFDCQECATDLRITAQFMDAARQEFKAHPMPTAVPAARKIVPEPKKRGFLSPAWLAAAACLLVIAYQNIRVVPQLRTEVAQLSAPEILPSLSLVTGNSRGGKVPTLAVSPNKSFLLSFDIPADERFSTYTCLLYSPTHSLLWRGEVGADAAKDTVSIRVPSTGQPGEYTLAVEGNGQGNSVHLMDDRFLITGLR